MFGASHCAHFVARSKILGLPQFLMGTSPGTMACTQSTEQAMPLPSPQSYCSLTLSFLLLRKSTIFFQKVLQFLSKSFFHTLLIACMMKAFIIIIIIIFFFEWIFSFWWQKSGGANDTTNFLNNNNNGTESPHYDSVQMFFWSHHIWTIGSNVPTCHHNRGGILTFFYFPL